MAVQPSPAMTAGVTPSGLVYRVTGSGPPLLWLSGYVVASPALDRYVAKFSGRYTCIVFDARGSGETRPARWGMTTASMARDALEVLRHLGHDAAHVHGLSLGGMVAQELAIRAPHRVLTLVLGATTAGGTSATPASLSTMWSSLGGTKSPVPGVGPVSWRGAFQQAVAATLHDAGGRLARVRAPTLVVHGARDRLLPPENADELARLIPGAQLHVLPRVGHFYPMKSGESAELILDWMQQQGNVTPGSKAKGRQVADLVQDVAAWPLRWTRAQFWPIRHAYRAMCRRPAVGRNGS